MAWTPQEGLPGVTVCVPILALYSLVKDVFPCGLLSFVILGRHSPAKQWCQGGTWPMSQVGTHIFFVRSVVANSFVQGFASTELTSTGPVVRLPCSRRRLYTKKSGRSIYSGRAVACPLPDLSSQVKCAVGMNPQIRMVHSAL